MMTMVQEITAYQYYNNDAKCRTQVNVSDRLFPELPDQKYDVIYCDPPWDYGGKMQFDRSSTDKEHFNPNGRKVRLLLNTLLLN